MPISDKLSLYIAIRKREDRLRMEDLLVLDGFDVSVFANAAAWWEAFQRKPARFVITDRRFGEEFDGIDLVRRIRQDYPLPYVYVVVLSVMNRLNEIKEGLGAGVDDYLIKPYNQFQARSRVLVGMRWLTYIDSLFEVKGQHEVVAPTASSDPRPRGRVDSQPNTATKARTLE